MFSVNQAKVTFLIDGSGSMSQSYAGNTRWAAALARARELVRHFPADTPVDLVMFGDEMMPPLSYPSAGNLLVAWEADVAFHTEPYPGGGSRIWDCLESIVDRFLDQRLPQAKLHIILLTDGEDQGSVRYRDEAMVRNKIARASGCIELSVLYFGDDAREEQRFRDRVRDAGGEVLSNPGEDIVAGIGKRLAESIAPLPPRISVTVIPLFADPAWGEIEQVQGLTGETVAFLELLTRLRYYPVPTMMVPDHIVRSVRRAINMDLPDRRELRHIAAVLGSFCLDFHVGNVGLSCRAQDGCSRCNLPVCREDRDLFDLMRGLSEMIGDSAVRWLEGDREDPLDSGYIMERADRLFRGCREYPERLDRALRYVTRVFTEIARQHPGMRIQSEYLRDDEGTERWRCYWNVNAKSWLIDWLSHNPAPRKKGAFPGTEYEFSVHTVAHVFRQLTPILVEGIKRLTGSSPNPLAGYFVTEVPAFGVYISSGSSDPQVRHQLATSGLPERLALPHSGRVLLCQETIDRFMGDLAGQDFERGEIRNLAARFLQSILVHEHMHAILAEGVDAGFGDAPAGLHPATCQVWREASVLNESLAEWAELHFFRSDDRMRELILSHVRAGRYPAWPYAGALKVEEIYARRGLDGVRQIIRDFRGDPTGALGCFNRGDYLQVATPFR